MNKQNLTTNNATGTMRKKPVLVTITPYNVSISEHVYSF